MIFNSREFIFSTNVYLPIICLPSTVYFSKCWHRVDFNTDTVLTLTEFTVLEDAGHLSPYYMQYILHGVRTKKES